MDAVNPLNILNTLNLEHGGALNGCCESSKHSEHSEFGTWCCFESCDILNTLNLEHGGALNGCCESALNSKHSEHSEFGTWWCFECTL